MNESYEKFKRKVMIEHFIKCLLYALTLSAGSTFILFAIFKRIPIILDFWVYLLIGLLISACIFTFIYKRFKPSDIEIAKRLDKNLALNQKVQTMTELQNQKGILVEMQRENTLEKLNEIPTKKVPMKFSASMFLTIFLSIAIGVGSFFVPIKEIEAKSNTSSSSSSSSSFDTNNSSTSTFNTEDNKTDQDKIDDIIKDVEDSTLSDQEKEDIKNELEDLKDKLENSENRDQDIEDTKDKIDQIIDQNNSKNLIGEELKKSSNTLIANLGEALISADSTKIHEALQAFVDYLTTLTDTELSNALEEIVNEIKLALQNSQVEDTDELYASLNKLADTLNKIGEDLKNALITNEEAYLRIAEAFKTAEEEINKALEQQIADEETKKEIDEKLDDMKNNPNGDKEEDGDGDNPTDKPNDGDGENDDNKGDNPDDENKNDNNNGSTGDGKNEYGSNDLIYSKDGESSEYGDVIDDYYTDVINGDTEGDVPEDIIDIIEDYFSILYGNGSGDGK